MKVDRLVSIIMVLLEKERIGAQELADMYEVSLRTIYRDVEAIAMSGIPIRSTPGVGGGFEIMPAYKVDKKVFSATDLSTILMGLTSLSNMVRGDELVNALTKVKSFIPAESAKDVELRANQIYVDLSPWMGNRQLQPYLELIKTALRENRVLSFSYIGYDGIKLERTAEPYQLVLKGNNWYWQAYCYLRKDFRLFKLSRTSNLQLLDQTFSPRDYVKPQLDIQEAVEKMQKIITIRIHHSIMDRVLDYCSFDHFIPNGDEYYIVRFPFIERDYYYDMLLSFGAQCECLEPAHVRAEMKRRINEISKLYESESNIGK